MKISYKHLISRIDEKPNIEELSNKLFQLGHEHEINGNVFDMELTPNRGDCLSVNGLLRDLSLFYSINNNLEFYKKDLNEFNFNFINHAKKDCPKISFLKIEIDSIPEKYNQEMESYFYDLNVKKNNFFTDISNYISYETGQPTHCYDMSEIAEGITLDYLKTKQNFNTLLDNKIELKAGDLAFINNKNEVINLAGIMGGSSTSCKKDTKSVLIECAYFNSEAIIGKSVQYALTSDAAHKFERGVDPNCHEYILRRFLKIVEECTKISNIEIYTESHSENKKNIVEFCEKKINKILGTNLSKKDCIGHLHNLGFENNESQIKIPSHRHDISSINDIAEEIARAIGYDNIDQKNLEFFSLKDKKINQNSSEFNLKNLLIDNGFSETINNPFTSVNDENSIEVDNPLDINRRFLRTDLKNSLLDNLLFNERRQKDSIKLFEISDIYSKSLSQKKRCIGIIISGRVDKNYKDFSKKLDINYLSNLINENILNIPNLNYETISRSSINSKSKNKIIYLEIEFSETFHCSYISNSKHENKIDTTYKPISSFPSSIRDLSFSVKEFSNFKPLQDYMLNFNDEFLKDSYIFDYFFNEKNDEIKIGFRLVFQSIDSTITEDQVNKIIDIIIADTKKLSGIAIPGLN